MGPFCGTDPHTDSDGVKNTTVKAKAKDLAAKDDVKVRIKANEFIKWMVTVTVINKTKHGAKLQRCTMWAHYQRIIII